MATYPTKLSFLENLDKKSPMIQPNFWLLNIWTNGVYSSNQNFGSWKNSEQKLSTNLTKNWRIGWRIFNLVFEFDQESVQVNATSLKWFAFWVKLVSDCFFTIDMGLSFRTGILLEGADKEVIINPKKIRKSYFK